MRGVTEATIDGARVTLVEQAPQTYSVVTNTKTIGEVSHDEERGGWQFEDFANDVWMYGFRTRQLAVANLLRSAGRAGNWGG